MGIVAVLFTEGYWVVQEGWSRFLGGVCFENRAHTCLLFGNVCDLRWGWRNNFGVDVKHRL